MAETNLVESARPAPVEGRAGREVARRWAVTALLVMVYWALERVPLPFLAPDALWDPSPSLLPAPVVSVLYVGLAPVLLAFVLIEMVALAVPRLRARRHGSAVDRAGLTRAAWFLAMAFAALGSGRTIATLRESAGPGGLPMLAGGPLAHVALALTLTAGTAVVSWIALAIGRHGLGNGFAVLIAAGICGRIPEVMAAVVATRELPLTVMLFTGGAVVLVAQALRERPGQAIRVPVPSCGLIPLVAANMALMLPFLLPWLHSSERWQALYEVVTAVQIPAEIVLAVALVFPFAALFTARGRVAAAWIAANLGAPPTPDALHRAVSRARRGSLLVVAGVAGAPAISLALDERYFVGPIALFALAMFAATIMDVTAEARAHARHGPLVAAFPFQRVYAVEPALAALAEAGVPAVARALRYRTLTQFFEPYAPIELLVPAARAEEAAVICARIARPEAAAQAVSLPDVSGVPR